MQNVKGFQIHLSDDDIADIRIIRAGRRMVGFVVNYRATIGGQTVNVARWDTCHWTLHVHRFWRPPHQEFGNVRADLAVLSVAEQFEGIREELRARWRGMRRLMETRQEREW